MNEIIFYAKLGCTRCQYCLTMFKLLPEFVIVYKDIAKPFDTATFNKHGGVWGKTELPFIIFKNNEHMEGEKVVEYLISLLNKKGIVIPTRPRKSNKIFTPETWEGKRRGCCHG